MKPGSWLYGSLVFLILTVSLAHPLIAADGVENSPNVAVVNGIPISRQRLDQRMAQAALNQAEPDRQQVLDKLILEEILWQEVEKQQLTIPKEQIDKMIKQKKWLFGSDGEYRAYLRANHQSDADFRADLERKVAIQELIRRETSKETKVSEAEIRAFYDRYPDRFERPEHVIADFVLVKIRPSMSEDQKSAARAKIENALQRIKKGEDFAQVADEVSEDPFRKKGRRMSRVWRGREDEQHFVDAAFALKPGEVSGIVKTPTGYYIIKTYKKFPKSTYSYAVVKKNIESDLKQEKKKTAEGAFINKLKAEAVVELK